MSFKQRLRDAVVFLPISIDNSSTMSSTAWADIIRNGAFHQAPEHETAIAIITAVIQNTQSASGAANAIAAAYEPIFALPQREANQNAVVAGTLWSIVSHAARMFGGSLEKAGRLVDLLLALIELPDANGVRGSTLTGEIGRQDVVLWRDLPGFGYMFREEGICTFLVLFLRLEFSYD